jgi:hypothetical protein
MRASREPANFGFPCPDSMELIGTASGVTTYPWKQREAWKGGSSMFRPARSFALPSAVFTAILCWGATTCYAQDSGGSLELHANSHATAADIGLPAYPGATLYKDSDNDAAVDLGLTLGDFHFDIKAANYQSSDTPERILKFYRKPLSRYGEVLECDHGKPVGSLAVTRSGLTCSDDEHAETKGNVNVSSGRELRAGTPHQYRVVGIDTSSSGATRFGLVYLDLPKDSDSKSK